MIFFLSSQMLQCCFPLVFSQIYVHCNEKCKWRLLIPDWVVFRFDNHRSERHSGWCLSDGLSEEELSRLYCVSLCRARAPSLSGPCGWLRLETICCPHTCTTSKGLWPSPIVLCSGGYSAPAGHSLRPRARNFTQPWPPSLESCEASGSLCPVRCLDLSTSTWGSHMPLHL